MAKEIFIEHRPYDPDSKFYTAYFNANGKLKKGQPGRTEEEAVGYLVLAHSEDFDIKIGTVEG